MAPGPIRREVMEPLWKRIDITKDGKLWADARNLAVYMHGQNWGPEHDRVVDAYLKKNR